ncbi:MAG TPA: hypothetical protein VKQ31_10260, partial [Steroidobacteraceae bacterium]|nr:hypothetical protein [Steroidobacteraceae bacterium]
MSSGASRSYRLGLRFSLALACAVPGTGLACACGCGVFDVGVGSLFVNHGGPMVFLEEDFLDQARTATGAAGSRQP